MASSPLSAARAGSSRVEHLVSYAVTLRRLRWAFAAFAALQLGLYRAPSTLSVPHPVRPWAIAVVAWLVLTNVISMRATRSRDVGRLERAAVAETASDAVLAVFVVALMSFDPVSAAWGLLCVVALEAALRLDPVRAWTTGALVTLGYLVVLWSAESRYEIDHRWSVAASRVATVVATAAVGGGLARQLRAHVAAVGRARDDADERARLLRIAADAGRSMAVLGSAEVLDAVVDATMQLGFDACDVCALDDAAGVWRLERAVGLPAEYVARGYHVDGGLSALVRRERRTVVVDDYVDWAGAVPEVQAGGFTTAVGVPIRVGGGIVATLGAGTRRHRRVSPAELECLELLAAQASAAFDAAFRDREARGLHERLVHSTSHDHLTGLPNRELLIERLATLLVPGRHRDGVAVVIADLDAFQTVNNSLGHHAGDQLLRAVAARLEATANGRLVARVGGDEFAVVVENGGIDAAMRLARILLVEFAVPFDIGGNDMVVSLSVGVAAEAQAPDPDAVSLLRDAGLALETAKRRGRGCIEQFDIGLRAHAELRLAAETDLREALSGDAFSVVYQPVVSLETGAIQGVEALARWSHPTRGEIAPAEFIPLAEETGVIHELGARVLADACRAATAWHRLAAAPLQVSVNVSPVQLRAADFVESVAAVLHETGLDPRQLVLELTESAVIDDVPEVLAAVEALAGLGVKLAIDDLGRGWSSLAYIDRYPLAELKIDRAFVRGVVACRADRAIIRSLVDLAHDLGLVVVAEGVEDAEQLVALARLGCDAGQGFHLHRPVPAGRIAGLLAAARPAVHGAPVLPG